MQSTFTTLNGLGILTAAQAGTCTIIKQNVVYIFQIITCITNVTGFLKDRGTQIDPLHDPSLSFNDWLNSWNGGEFWSTIKGHFHVLLFS